MKFLITENVYNDWTWRLINRRGRHIASSPTSYPNIVRATASAGEFNKQLKVRAKKTEVICNNSSRQ